MNIKPKKCKGVGITLGFGCEKITTYQRKYGLCSTCYFDWLNNSENGKIKKEKSKIKKISTKRKMENQEYLKLRNEFLSRPENKFCPVTGELTTDVHHKRGRIGKLLNATSFWLAVSREGHRFIEENPTIAKNQGWSLDRI